MKTIYYQEYRPPITLFICLLSVVLFVGINLEGDTYSWDAYSKWGGPSFIDLYSGQYWGLLTNNFLHVEVWHLGFNLYWTWIFGKKIEWESSPLFYVLFVITAGIMSSFGQLGFASASGIGLSGIGYAFFGYLFVKNRVDENYQGFLDQRIINLFLIWLVVCVVLTKTELLNIANAAHFAGLIWGLAIAYGAELGKIQQWLIGIGLLVLLGTSPFWNPWAISWLSYQAYTLHKGDQIEEAIALYKEILVRDGDNEFAGENLKDLEVYRLSQEAYQLHSNGKLEEAMKVYEEILNIDSRNKFAQNNSKELKIFFLTQEALQWYEDGERELAIEVCKEILKLDKDDEFAKNSLDYWLEE